MENEVLNQEQQADIVANDDENLFSDVVVDETTTEEKQEPVQETTEEVKPEEVKEEAPFLEIKFNKETKGLSQDEARELAQKGMNYDKVLDKFNNLNSSLENLARRNGKNDISDYLQMLSDVQNENDVLDEIEKLKQEHPDTDEAVLKELAESRVRENNNFQFKKIEEEENARANAKQEEVEREIQQFRDEFPDVDLANLPQEVISMIENGYPLMTAYYKYIYSESEKNRTLEAEKAKIDKQNESNKLRSLGNTTNAGSEEGDDFFDGLNSI